MLVVTAAAGHLQTARRTDMDLIGADREGEIGWHNSRGDLSAKGRRIWSVPSSLHTSGADRLALRSRSANRLGRLVLVFKLLLRSLR